MFMDEIDDLQEKMRLNLGNVTFNSLDLDFKIGEISPIEIIEKQIITVEIYDSQRDRSNAIF